MFTKRISIIIFALTVMVTGLVSTANADSVTFSLGNNPQADDENVLMNNGSIGAVVFGLTNQSSSQVRFDSTTDTLVEPSSGQARVEAQDGILNNISISIPGGTFTSLILNPFQGSGTANVTVVTASSSFDFAYPIGNGQNFLTIVADPGTVIFSVTVNASGGFQDLRQVRIGGVGAVPEPATLTLLGIGLFTAAAVIRYKRNHR